MEINEIVSLIKNKDENGLSHLYDQYASTLMGLITRVVQSKELSEEILQQVFLKIWNKIDLYDESKSSFYTWIARISRNTAIDHRRLIGFKNQQKTDDIEQTDYRLKARTDINLAKIDTDYLMQSMDDKYRIVLDHIYLQGYSQSQTSELLDIPLGTIKTRLKKSIEILRATLKNEQSTFMCNLFFFFLIIYLLWN